MCHFPYTLEIKQFPCRKSDADYFDALRTRESIRAYDATPLSLQDLGDVLWTAGGQKTPGGKWIIPYAMRTEPTCKIYVACAEGLYFYDGESHSLSLVYDKDLRTELSVQEFAHSAPYSLVFVITPDPLIKKMPNKSPREVLDLIYLSCGAIMQDVYLAAAAKGLGTCYVANIKPKALNEPLKLGENDIFLGVMPIGYILE